VWGTCLVVGAAMVFAVVALVVKVDPLPLLPATECRFFVSWVIAAAFMLWFRKSRGLHWFGPPELRSMLLLKSAVSFGFIVLWWAALRRAPIGDCIAIIYSSPVLTSLLSLCFLGEKLPREFPLQVVLTSAGTLLVLDPPFLHHGGAGSPAAGPGQDYTAVLLALFLCSLAPVVTRETRACSWIEVEHVGAAMACLVMDPALLGVKYAIYGTLPSMPSTAPREVALIMLAAAGSFVGIAMETKGYQLAEPGKATMFRYVEVPFAYLLQHFGTGSPVTPKAAVGALLIVGACFISVLARSGAANKAEGKAQATEPLLDGATVDAQGA